MDSIRVSKVENVLCTKYAIHSIGSVHLTAHHLIFRYADDNREELWVPYPLVSLVTRHPLTLQGNFPLTIHCRTFESFTLSFSKDSDADDVFESVKELTVATSVTQLYAFYYVPNPPLSSSTGWTIYSPREEFGRMGVGTRTKAWRFTDINKDYLFCPTYPARLVVPTKISDMTLQYASKYRSKCRIPVLTYLHWSNYATITRSSQPMVGITQNRSVQDEKLIESIFQTHHSPDTRAFTGPVYGATTTNIIIDARPTTNAVANTAKGAGTENMDHYKEAKKAYLGIDNIHVMRDSLVKVVEAIREADSMSASITQNLNADVKGLMFLDRHALRRSGWLRHISTILEGALLIIRNVHINSSHVLIHCSDGWDRTAQLSSIAQLCLDPFYRTMRGFQILIEKDWLSFGHKFLDRCGHLSSEKFFLSSSETAVGSDSAQSFLASVQNKFTSQQHLKETSPVFHQFLETVRQVQRQFPERFEFNERLLRQIHYHLYSCQFGTFLFNCERERKAGEGGLPYVERTVSVWDFFNMPEELAKNTNPDYDGSLDDPMSRAPKADMGILYPNPKDVRFWHELYGRTDEEMNGRVAIAQAEECSDGLGDDPTGSGLAIPTPSKISLPNTPSPSHSPSLLAIGLPPATKNPLPATPRKSSPPFFSVSSETQESSADSPSGSGSMPSLRRPVSFSHSPSPSSPNFFTSRSADLFSSGGVKSMWGKFSSNASAAFSVVQDAYAGVAKDFKSSPNSGERELAETNADFRETGGWSDDQHPSGLRAEMPRSTFGPSSNPWASVKSRSSSVPSLFENPWSSAEATPPSSERDRSLTGMGSLPPDPTVAHPPPLPVGPQPHGTRKATSDADQPTSPTTHIISFSNSDPLGVSSV